MDIEVTLVSRKAEPLSEAASAIQVITREDIRRAGVSTLPEALRLASNLHVAQITSAAFAISARGLNSASNTLANKLLVMIDGRSVYTPLYSGVFWDAQNLILDNIDRIEVVSGPGGSVWGANAVNGVINIVTRPATETVGLFAEAGAGTFVRDFAALRFGGRAEPGFAFRVFGQRMDHRSALVAGGAEATDPWSFTSGGFRTDWEPSAWDHVTAQGWAMVSEADQVTGRPDSVEFNSQSLQLRWNRKFSAASDLQVKGYFDRTYRNIPASFQEQLFSYDLDAHHRFSPFPGNSLMWGAGYRWQVQEVANPPPATPGGAFFVPERKALPLFSAFLQDQHDLWDGRLRLTAGTRVERNTYTDWEVMPTARAAWSPVQQHTLWTALSRAVRSPGRIDVEVLTPHPSLLVGDTSTPRLVGGPDFRSEELLAYELGYRLALHQRASLSLSGFYHVYSGLRILEFVSPVSLQFTNGAEGEVYGAELAGHWQVLRTWRLGAGVTHMRRDFRLMPGHAELAAPGNRGNDPEWQGVAHSWLDLPMGFELNGTARWVAELPAPAVPAYGTLDLGVVWRGHGFEVSIYGRNLREEGHPEFAVADAGAVAEIPRSVIGRVAWRL